MFEKKNIHGKFIVGIVFFLLAVVALSSVPAMAVNWAATTLWTDWAFAGYTVSAQVHSSLYGVPENLYDQELTQWTGGWDSPKWAMVDVGEPRSIGGVSITGHAEDGGRALRIFQVQYGSATADPTVDGDWTNIVSYDAGLSYDPLHCHYAFGFPPVTAQRIRLKIDDAGPDLAQIRELQVWSGAAPTMSGMHGGPAAWAIVDGEKGGACANYRPVLGGGRCWWMVDIGPDKLVGSVDMWFPPGYAEKDYVLQYGDGDADPYYETDWTDIVDVNGNTDTSVSHSFAAVGAQRIRVISTANVVGDDFGRLSEIQINGPTGPCDTYLVGDISGPNGIPDCYVDVYDLGKLGEQWLDCTIIDDPNCN